MKMYKHKFKILLKILLIAFSMFWMGGSVAGQSLKRPGKMVQIHLRAVAGLHYDNVRFKVSPGARVRLTLVNTDDMDHNLVFTEAGKRASVIAAAQALGNKGPALHYIPAIPAVLWHIATVRPDDSAVIHFTAPEKEGAYPYVCTYPGHGATMYGVMYVSERPMPPLANDPNVPSTHHAASGTMADMEHERLHPYTVTPPYLIRTFMPDAGAAAIAVNLPDSLSYCWDAGACRLRYAWKGKFLSHMDLWKRKGDETARVAGQVFFRDETDYPFRIGKERTVPTVQFKGYRLVEGYPEFHYLIGGITVYERIKPADQGRSLVRIFRMTGVTQTIWFLKRPDKGVVISASKGKWQHDRLALTPEEASSFSITITEK